ncbi:MAG: carboxypeptidase regulatory-like domain-containing protein [Bacteroidota bacterium]
MKKYLLIFIALVTINQIGFSQTILCTPPSDVCESGNYNIAYTADFTPGASNIFTVELSDEFGLFGSPLVVGSAVSTLSTDNISFTMPSSFVPGGVYFIRVNSSDIPVDGTSAFINAIKPNADAGIDQGICSTAGSANLIAFADDYTNVSWVSNGTGTFSPNNTVLNPDYIPNVADEGQTLTLTMIVSHSSCPSSDTYDDMLLTIEAQSSVNAGSNIIICANENVNLSGSLFGMGAIWSSSGGGFFDNSTSMNAIYTPDANDIINGSVQLTLSAVGGGYCSAPSDAVDITINPGPTVNAGFDQSICNGPFTTLSGSFTGATGIIWSSPTGTFTDDTDPSSDYYPSGLEFSAGEAVIAIETTGNGICMPVRDTVFITLYNAPVIDAGLDQTICEGSNANLNGFVNGGPQTPTMFWSTTGSGTFTDINDPNAIYTPHAADITAGSVSLIANAVHGSCLNYRDTMQITFKPLPVVNFTAPASACAFNPVTFTDVSTISSGSIVGYNWFFADDSSTGNTSTITHSYNTGGVFGITLDVTSDLGCVSSGGWNIIITSGVDLAINVIGNDTICQGESLILSAVSSDATSYNWLNTAETTTTIHLSQPTVSEYYVVQAQNASCSRKDSVYVMVKMKPSLSFTITDATCGNANGAATALPSGSSPFQYLWNHNGSTVAFVTGLIADSYLFTLTDKSGCTQTAYANIGNADGPVISGVSNTNASCASVCDGSTTVSVSGGAAPYVFNWGTLSAANSPSVSAICVGNHSFSITDANSCVTNGVASISANGTDPIIFGKVSLSSTGINNGVVELLGNTPGTLAMAAYATANVDANGNYVFSGVPAGSYLLSAEANDVAYPFAAKTYYVNANNWLDATSVSATCNTSAERNINLIGFAAMTGSDLVRGTIYDLNPGKTNVVGDPIPGVDVSLEQNPGGIMVAQTTTDNDGKYEFANVPTGSFTLFVDMPGVGMTSSHEIVTGGGAVHEDNNFYVDSALTIYSTEPVTTLSSVKENKKELVVKAYPNPFTSQLTVAINAEPNAVATIALYSILGENIVELESKLPRKNNHIALSNLEKLKTGVYILKIKVNQTEEIIRVVKSE